MDSTDFLSDEDKAKLASKLGDSGLPDWLANLPSTGSQPDQSGDWSGSAGTMRDSTDAPAMDPVVKQHIMQNVMAKAAAIDPSAGSAPADMSKQDAPDDMGPPLASKENPLAAPKPVQPGFVEQLKAAQDRANDRQGGLAGWQLLAGLGDAVAGRPGASVGQFDKMRANIQDQEVGQLSQRHGAELQEQDIQRKNDMYDPNSRQSQVVQQTIRKLYGDKFSEDQIKTMTGADQDLILKPLELNAKLEENKSNMQMRNEMMKQGQQDRRDKAQGDSYQKATHDLNTFRGNTAVQQASSALINVKNALSLANKGNLSPDQLHLFAAEMGKLATNGVPGSAEIQALIPDTMKTRMAKVTSFFSNSPSDADAQAFINNNKTYLNELANNYQGVVNKYQTNIIDGYKHKLSKDDFDDLSKRYAPVEPVPAQSGKKPSWAQ
jgi:hypothetical protein